MGKPLHALIVEDDERDAELLLRELRRGEYDVTFERVETAEAMLEALKRKRWDIVLSDYSMPRFSGPAALAIVRRLKLDLPFIIVSGTVGEDIAVEALHAGAQDFMAKGKLARLIPAIERELRDVALRAERAKMQEQLLISDRMASVGTLAAGVAHEINNPLATLMANLGFVTADVTRLVRDLQSRALTGDAKNQSAEPSGEGWIVERLREIEEPLRDADEAANRVRDIVRDLKIFSRGSEETGPVDIRQVLESSLRMAWNEIRHRARLVKEHADVPAVEGNEGRLCQVFLNLIVNAAQSIPEGNANKNEIRIVTKKDEQGRVVVEVRDTGSGIPESMRSRIFDPFVTTKPVGIGTGLGLAICHRIVTGLGGQIVVESEVGRGTTFRTILPAAAEPASHSEAVAPSAPVDQARRGRILIVDDEPMLGTSIRRILSSEHEVSAVTTAREAIRRILEAGEQFDLVLCDLMMPEMTGMDLHAELQRTAPEQADRMVFMTGGVFTTRSREFLETTKNPRLEKPFDAGVLKALVRSLLR